MKKPRRLDWTALTTRLMVTTSIATVLMVAHTAYSDSGTADASAVVAAGSGSASSAAPDATPVGGSGSASAAPGSGSGSDKVAEAPPSGLPAAPGFGDIASAFGAGEFALGTSLLILMVVGAARSAGVWKTSKLGGWLLNFLGSFAAVLGTAALAHVHITYKVLGGTLVTALSTAGLLELGRDVVDWWKSRGEPKLT